MVLDASVTCTKGIRHQGKHLLKLLEDDKLLQPENDDGDYKKNTATFQAVWLMMRLDPKVRADFKDWVVNMQQFVVTEVSSNSLYLNFCLVCRSFSVNL